MERMMWKPMKAVYCEKAEQEVALEVKVVYPAEFLPEQPPRVLAHRCSAALDCNMLDRPSCIWTGTLPGFDPFA